MPLRRGFVSQEDGSMNYGSGPVRGYWKSVLFILIGTAIYAFGLHYFIIANELMEGGLTGIAVLLNYVAGLPASLTTLIINVPLFVIGWRLLGKEQMAYTMLGTLALSLFLWIMEVLIEEQWITPFRTQDYFLAAAYAGVTLGTGLGIVFRSGGTTGGADIIARIVQKKTGWSMGRFILLFDAAVIGASLFFIPRELVLYTIISVFIATKLIDIIIEGAYAARAFLIMTSRSEQVAGAVMKQLDRGVTFMPVVGAYSGEQKQAVYCVVARSELKRVKDIVRMADPKAFIVITEVQDVLGEGFKPE